MTIISNITPNAQAAYQYAAAIGLYLNTTRVATLGNNPDVDTVTQPEDVWSGAGLGVLGGWDHKLIPMPTSALAMEIVSDSVNDTAAGTGARTVLVSYLAAGYVPKTFSASLNGATPVAFPEDVLRINRAIVTAAGTVRGANAGNISIRDAGGAGKTYAHIPAPVSFPSPRGLARSSLYTVPADFSLDLISLILSVNRTDTNDRWATFTLNTQNSAGVAIEGIELSASTNVPYRHEADGIPVVTVAEKTDIWITCLAVSQSNINCTAGFIGIQRPKVF